MLKTIVNFLKHSLRKKTIRNIGALSIGNGLSQLISIIGAFYIPRILGPDHYGSLSTVLAYVALFTLFSFTGLDRAISRASARNLAATQSYIEGFIGIKLLCSLGAVLLCILSLLFVSYEITTKIYISIYSFFLLVSPSIGFVNVVYQSSERLKYVAFVNVFQNLTTVSLSIVLVYLGYGVMALLVVRLIIVAATLILSTHILSTRFFKLRLNRRLAFDKTRIYEGLRFSTLQFFNSLSTRVDVVMLSFMATPVEVGLYALAYNISEKILIVRGGVSDSIFPSYTKKREQGVIRFPDLVRHALLLFIPASVIIAGTYLFSDWVILNLIGEDYLRSAAILKVLIIYLFFNFAVIPFGVYLQTSNHEVQIIKVVIVKSIFNIAGNWILYHQMGLIGIALSTLINEFISLVLQIAIAHKKIKLINEG